jgi:geranylgeranyl diphosphate synthase type II
MNTPLSPARIAGIDAAIAAALDRMRARARGRGEGIDDLIDAIARATVGGKRFRPALVAAGFAAWDGPAHRADALNQVAAAFELLHTAFVVHDDVIDHDTVRRGVPNVAGEFLARSLRSGVDELGAARVGEAAGILAGDLLLYEASRTVALADLPSDLRADVFAIMDDAVLISAAGELADVEHALARRMPQPAALVQAAHDKTAVYSFAAPLEAGAALADAPLPERSLLAACGGRLGLAYQLVDDLIGAFGTDGQAGRAAGADLREAKRTPLLGFAYASEQWEQVSDAVALARTGPVAVRAAQAALDDAGARVRLADMIARTLDEARAMSDPLPTPARSLVIALADEVAERIP